MNDKTMQGAVLIGPEAIEVRELPIPEPGPGEMLVKIGAATTCGTDVKVYRRGGHPRMLTVPTLFGHEMAGSVAKLGAGVTRFAEGDAIVVSNSAPCMVCEPCRRGRENLCEDQHYLNGAFADYILVPERFVERSCHPIPAGLSFERAALTEPLACVLHGLDACEPTDFAGDEPIEAVVFGGGPIGLLFVAALAAKGQEVVLADPNSSRLEVGREMGAGKTHLVEREHEQAGALRAMSRGGKGFWLSIDATGLPSVWQDAINSLRPGGVVNLFGGCARGTSISLDTHFVHYSEITVKGVYHHRPDTVRRALGLLADPNFPADVLFSKTLPVSAVDEAMQAMIKRQALKVVIRG